MKSVQLTEAQVESLIREVQHDATTTALITAKAVIAQGGDAKDIVTTLESVLDTLTVAKDEALARAEMGETVDITKRPEGVDITKLKGDKGNKADKGLN